MISDGELFGRAVLPDAVYHAAAPKRIALYAIRNSYNAIFSAATDTSFDQDLLADIGYNEDLDDSVKSSQPSGKGGEANVIYLGGFELREGAPLFADGQLVPDADRGGVRLKLTKSGKIKGEFKTIELSRPPASIKKKL